LAQWYAQAARDLPWRHPQASAWSVLVSEIMLQQTPVVRVLPTWQAWLERWPTPADLAAAPPGAVIAAWGALGYPRRALRLRQAAVVIVEQWGGAVPEDEAGLRALPGVGDYTAAAVACFAFTRRAVVLDTNVRRVLARVWWGQALPAPSRSRAEHAWAAQLLPDDPAAAKTWNQALMELGALVCRARDPACASCPLRGWCAWRQAGQPADPYATRRRVQGWEGTDRQARGRVMAALRTAGGEPVAVGAILADSPRPEQTERAIDTLVADGLAVRVGSGVSLP
jgi:A/G-specific adenine glycosylase